MICLANGGTLSELELRFCICMYYTLYKSSFLIPDVTPCGDNLFQGDVKLQENRVTGRSLMTLLSSCLGGFGLYTEIKGTPDCTLYVYSLSKSFK